MAVDRKLVGIRVAAARLGISEWTLRRWLAQRRLPYTKLGGRVLIAPADLDAFIDANRVPARVGPAAARL